jgi:hypothetical protein
VGSVGQRERAHDGQSTLTGRTHQAARGSERAREEIGTDMLDPLGSERERGREHAGEGWH